MYPKRHLTVICSLTRTLGSQTLSVSKGVLMDLQLYWVMWGHSGSSRQGPPPQVPQSSPLRQESLTTASTLSGLSLKTRWFSWWALLHLTNRSQSLRVICLHFPLNVNPSLSELSSPGFLSGVCFSIGPEQSGILERLGKGGLDKIHLRLVGKTLPLSTKVPKLFLSESPTQNSQLLGRILVQWLWGWGWGSPQIYISNELLRKFWCRLSANHI